jgi:hypothetical protein
MSTSSPYCRALLQERRPNQTPDRTAASHRVWQRALALRRQIVCWRFLVVGGCRSAHCWAL